MIAAAALAALALPACRSEYHFPEDSVTELYKAGVDGYHTYRIPAMVATRQGSILAFTEARLNTHRDFGDKDIVLKRSTDGGKTWSGNIMVLEDSIQACGNPVPFVLDNGRIVLLSMWKDRTGEERYPPAYGTYRAFVQHSDDDGLTWSDPKDVTPAFQTPADSNWIKFLTGPGHGLVLTEGEHAGRLVAPCYYQWVGEDRKWQGRAFFMISDDDGETWRRGAFATTGDESSAAQLSNGDIMLNSREFTRWREEHLIGWESRRLVAVSKDGGETLSPSELDWNLPEPRCEGSILRYRHGHEDEDWLLFVNPSSTKQRYNLQVKLSKDGGKSWKSIYKAPYTMCAYSDMAELPDGSVAVIYEAGEETMRECLAFDIIPRSWID